MTTQLNYLVHKHTIQFQLRMMQPSLVGPDLIKR